MPKKCAQKMCSKNAPKKCAQKMRPKNAPKKDAKKDGWSSCQVTEGMCTYNQGDAGD
jgi:hypothetical protein